MGKKILASVMNAEGFVQTNNGLKHVLSAKTLTDSTFNFTSTMEEVRGGQGAKLYARINHDTGMTVSLTDAIFDLDYIKYQIGAKDEADAKRIMATESVRITKPASGDIEITLSKDPKEFGKANGLRDVCVWLRKKGEDNYDEDLCITSGKNGNTISGKKVTIDDASEAYAKLESGDYCVTYFIVDNSNSTKALQVMAEFAPSELILVLEGNEYAAGSNENGAAGAIGKLTVKIPRFQLDGAFDLSMAMSSAATVSLAGTALAVEDGSCDGKGIYCEIVENDINATSASFEYIFFDPDVHTVGKAPIVYGVKKGGYEKVENSILTFTPELDNAGLFATAGSQKVKYGTLEDNIQVEAAP